MSISDRTRDALLAKGLDPTPENLSRVSGLPLEDARMVLAMREPPEIVTKLARVARSLDVRLLWLSTGATLPQVTGRMTEAELRALDLISDLDNSGVRRWLRFGGRLTKSR